MFGLMDTKIKFRGGHLSRAAYCRRHHVFFLHQTVHRLSNLCSELCSNSLSNFSNEPSFFGPTRQSYRRFVHNLEKLVIFLRDFCAISRDFARDTANVAHAL